MRRIVLASLTTATSVGLLMAYPTSHNASTASSGSTTRASSAGSSATPAKAVAGSKTYDGDPVDTRWGVVQVRITVKSGKVVSAKALQYPNDNGHSQDINAFALPILNAEAVKAGSASIDAVGGATVTSGGYTSSLQSALDAAKL
jgi:uncharacterized protein with FMN-binding domain